jgi:hypothetical protein
VDGATGPAHRGRADLRQFDSDAVLGAPQGAGVGAGQVASGHGVVGAAVAAWPAMALVGSYELLMAQVSAEVPGVAGVPDRVPDGDPQHVQAANVFAGYLAADRVPSIRVMGAASCRATARAAGPGVSGHPRQRITNSGDDRTSVGKRSGAEVGTPPLAP